jgi:hypothetical protein
MRFTTPADVRSTAEYPVADLDSLDLGPSGNEAAMPP